MLKAFDTKCSDCGQIIEQYVESNEQFRDCPVCCGKMKRIFNTLNYKLIYNNKTDMCSWGDHGYVSSQYWSKIKEAERNTGKRHKSIYED